MSESPPQLSRATSEAHMDEAIDAIANGTESGDDELVEDWSSFAKPPSPLETVNGTSAANGHDKPAKSSSSQRSGGGDAQDEGSRSFPVARMKVILGSCSASEALNPNAEALFAANKATELFVERLVKGAFEAGDTTAIDYDEIALYIRNNDELSFLHDFFPKRRPALEAMKMIQQKLATKKAKDKK